MKTNPYSCEGPAPRDFLIDVLAPKKTPGHPRLKATPVDNDPYGFKFKSGEEDLATFNIDIDKCRIDNERYHFLRGSFTYTPNPYVSSKTIIIVDKEDKLIRKIRPDQIMDLRRKIHEISEDGQEAGRKYGLRTSVSGSLWDNDYNLFIGVYNERENVSGAVSLSFKESEPDGWMYIEPVSPDGKTLGEFKEWDKVGYFPPLEKHEKVRGEKQRPFSVRWVGNFMYRIRQNKS